MRKLSVCVMVMVLLVPWAANAASITIDATAAEVARVVEAKAIVEANLGRSLTNEQFVKHAVRELVQRLLEAKQNALNEFTTGGANATFRSSLDADFPSALGE